MTSTPYDSTNSTNPWLMDKKSVPPIVGPEGKPLTAQYIWDKQGDAREELVEWVFNYYRGRGFPFFKLTDQELKDEFDRLKLKDPNEILESGYLKNSGTVALNIAKHFTSDLFYASKSSGKSNSCLDVFNDDDLFKKVLKNRMGWCTSKEDGKKRPYVFAINDSMIVQGMRSSGLGYSVSHFKPVIAKYIYEKYNAKKVIDYSCGWGARCIAALSIGAEYYGIDPLTAGRVNEIIKYFGGTGNCVSSCSENTDFSIFPDVDMCFSSPPYFDLEIYADKNQSSDYNNYSDWLDKYWKATVEKCYPKSKYFSFVAVEKVKKFYLLEDMAKVCTDLGGKLIEKIPIKTSAGHLSAKRTTKRVDKKTEHVLVYRVK